jgi:hypothetical protein
MDIKRGDKFKNNYSKKIYLAGGKWSGTFILIPEDTSNEECLVYTKSEVEELFSKIK